MTTVNWEREPGEKVEEFVAAMLLLDHPQGNRITPSRGDRGVDIRVWNSDGYDIYQVKRYANTLNAKQAAAVEASWQRFVEETLPFLHVRSWTLVMPWEPTNERLKWLEELTAGSGIRCNWMGRATLDGMASRRATMVDYYFGDGGQRLHRLMSDVLHGGRDIPQGAPAEDLLDAVITRQRSLSVALNDVDPIYRYEVDVRTGKLREQPWEFDSGGTLPAAFVRYTQLDPDHYAVLRLVPLSAESHRLRPITTSIRLEVADDSPERQAVEEFFRYGAPFQDVPGTVTAGSGPPGTASTGQGWFTFMATAGSAHDHPDLEIRLISTDGFILHAIDLVDVQVSHGLDGHGSWLSGHDRGAALKLQFFLNGPDGDELRLNSCSLHGKTPAQVLPALRMVADFAAGTGLVLAVRGGKAITSAWELGETEMVGNARWHVALLESLLAIQQHTFHRVLVPDVDNTPRRKLVDILRAGRLLRGEQLEDSWTELSLTVSAPDNMPSPDLDEFSLRLTAPLVVELDGEEVELDMQRRTLYQTARIADQDVHRSVQAGDVIRIVPGSSHTAITVAVAIEES